MKKKIIAEIDRRIKDIKFLGAAYSSVTPFEAKTRIKELKSLRDFIGKLKK